MNNTHSICQLKTSPEPSTRFEEKTPNIKGSFTTGIKRPNKEERGTTQKRKELFIQRAGKIHKNKYSYSNSNYVNTYTPTEIICPIHGKFLQTPHNHLSGQGCKTCGIAARSLIRTSSTLKFVEKARAAYGSKYDYSKTEYINNHTKVVIGCPIHGEFIQNPNSHLRGAECPSCFGTPKKSSADFINDAIRLWGGRYDYSEVKYDGNKNKVRIICRKHGTFLQTPNDHLTGYGCPRCQLSKGERKIEQYLLAHNINYVRQKVFIDCINPKTNQKLKFDFYIPAENVLIEYDGEQHFRGGYVGCHKMSDIEVADLKARDRIKTVYTKSKKIKLLRIKYTFFHKIDAILSHKLRPVSDN